MFHEFTHPQTPESPSDRGEVPKLARRRRWVAAVAVGALLFTAAGLAASLVVKSPAQAAADSEAPPSDVLTAPVERRVLKDSVIIRGTVTATQSVEIAPAVAGPDGGTAVVTKLGLKAADTFEAGRVLLEISGRPVFALRGKLPVYRDLKPGSEGDDVKQLQRALRALGHSAGTDTSGVFGAGTKTALDSFYSSIGYDPLPALRGGKAALETAEDRVTAAGRAVEDAEGAEGAEEIRASAETPSGKPDKAVKRAKEDLAEAREDLAAIQAESGPMLPAGEVVFLDGFPARVDSVTARPGTKVTGPVMTVSAGALVVDSHLQQHQKELVHPRQKVEILSELTGITATATVRSVADTLDSVRQDDTAAGKDGDTPPGGQGYLMTVAPDKPLDAELAGQEVRLTVEAASTEGKALVVPVTAITSRADGKTVVTVLGTDRTPRAVEVRPGTTGDGFVQITPVAGGRLSEGDHVVTGIRATGEAAE
ncbi:peptidoglycan-binding protein [Streptomyces aurantiacus]|uniref:Peptidoglycan binding-like domain-containing protein n=1 Tax=Streptomyces aurantiacus TaxID=47760 RepID=A0A7G1NV32_9ACTN|nr:peptidoglycan-binding domain-containing protein [Streptomyces aurantiacus]BCL27213.1 hypothetical protein GCM10017557_20720 [Streptomyces aurantiacus]